MHPRTIRALAVNGSGDVYAADGSERVAVLVGGWPVDFVEFERGAAISALARSRDGRVLALDSASRRLWTISGRSLEPASDYVFRAPSAVIATDTGILVADVDAALPVIVRIADEHLAKTPLSPFAGQVSSMSTREDGLIIAAPESIGPRLLAAKLDSGVWNTSNLAGSSTDAGDSDGPGDIARFVRPAALAPAPEGGCWIADGARIRIVLADGAVRSIAGGAPGFRDGEGADARFGPIGSVASDRNGELYVADTQNGAIRRVDSLGCVSTIAGPRVASPLTSGDAATLARQFARAVVDDDTLEAEGIACRFILDHSARGDAWPDRTLQPVSVASARIGKDLAETWQRSSDPLRHRLGAFCLWLILSEERSASTDEIRDARARQVWAELTAGRQK